jgi:cell division FtsZ-interacting protein ZapD
MEKMTTKSEMVKKHLKKKKTTTSWQAIDLYKATRLSAIIFELRHRHNWVIDSKPMSKKDSNGENLNFVKYVLISTPSTK